MVIFAQLMSWFEPTASWSLLGPGQSPAGLLAAWQDGPGAVSAAPC